MKTLKINEFGPISDLSIDFGDLTLFVGPQASGKSLVLQLLKLITDKKHIRKTLEQYGFSWGSDEGAILNRYFGEGMASIWNDQTKLIIDGKTIDKNILLPKQRENIKDATEKLFYIPAQRVICLQEGWPRFFTAYEDSVPYVLRYFSESIRLFMEASYGKYSDSVFPKPQSLKSPLRDAFNKSIFHDGKIKLDTLGKKRFMLEIGDSMLPYLTWSAGQKEFMPLLLSFYYLCPASKSARKDDFKFVVIEEPEMGLHPQAIIAIVLQIIDLLSRDYKVIVSTHSPVLLEFAWAFQFLKEAGIESEGLYKLFNLKKSQPLNRLFEGILQNKTINSYAFTQSAQGIIIKNISTLDAGNTDPDIAEWGGLSTFSSRASEIISETVSNLD
jgi:energy-coupling factor transporter ATP-binding protein EcfA2